MSKGKNGPEAGKDDNAENSEKKGDYDKKGFFIYADGSFLDPDGYFFDKKGYDELGGHYDENNKYLPPVLPRASESSEPPKAPSREQNKEHTGKYHQRDK